MDFKKNVGKDLVYYTIPSFENTGLVKHCFTSRLFFKEKAVNENFDLNPKDINDNINRYDNYKKLSAALDIPIENFTLSDQIHGDNIYVVKENDKGKGLSSKVIIHGTDAMITNERNIALTTFYADCVPLYILDPIKKAIGLAHSGWKGTVKKIGAKTLRKMSDEYGTNPSDCLIGIGPSIGQCCFETGPEVFEKFKAHYPDSFSDFVKERHERYYIDLWSANKAQFIKLGVPQNNITVSCLCTLCNKDVFFSYRGESGNTGRMAAVLMLL